MQDVVPELSLQQLFTVELGCLLPVDEGYGTICAIVTSPFSMTWVPPLRLCLLRIPHSHFVSTDGRVGRDTMTRESKAIDSRI